jgi:DNA-binding beta-propeller fold protein YncE
MRIASSALLLGVLLGTPGAAFGQSRDLLTYLLFGETEVLLGTRVAVAHGDVGSNGTVSLKPLAVLGQPATVAGDVLRFSPGAAVAGASFFNSMEANGATVTGPTSSPLTLPLLALPAPAAPAPGVLDLVAQIGAERLVPAGAAFDLIRAVRGSTLTFLGGVADADTLIVHGGGSTVRCLAPAGCTVRVRSRLLLRAESVGLVGGPITFEFAGSARVEVGRAGGEVRATVHAPLASIRLVSSRKRPTTFIGQLAGAAIRVGNGASVRRTVEPPLCGDGAVTIPEECDSLADAACPGQCRTDCTCRPQVCGDGFVTPPEACDGAADAACPNLCAPDCTCPPPTCGDGYVTAPEECDPPADAACSGTCLPDCTCPGPPVLHSVGPSVLQNATAFGIQLFGERFLPGAEVELSDAVTSAVITVLPTTWVSSREVTALVPPGMAVPSGIQRELVARVINPGGFVSGPPVVGHCQTDAPNSPTACTSDAGCPPGTGSCVTGDQRLTMFNDLVFLNPNSAAVVPGPDGLCDDGSRCQADAACAGIGSGTCAPKLYVTPQQRDELWVYATGTAQFVDQDPGQAGILGIPVGDNPFHIEILSAGGPARAWVVNRFDDSFSIIDPATDTEIERVPGAALGVPGRLRMETEIEFNRAGTRAYLSNENLDEVQVLDIGGPRRDAPVLLTTIDVGVNPRGMATNAADTRLYVANIQSADISVVDIAPGSVTENQVLHTILTRATDDIVGGRAEGWEPFVISGRAPRGITYSDVHDALFVTSIGPQTGPRGGVGQVGGAIVNPTITVIDPATETVVAHVALNGLDANRPSCTDPELMALDDPRNRLYVTCQGSGTVDVLDTVALAAGAPAELGIVALPLPTDVPVPTLAIPSLVGPFGAKVCAGFSSMAGAPCTTDAQCGSCPGTIDGIPFPCCGVNNPIGLHNGPRGIALSADRGTLYVVNQFTTSVAALDVTPADPALIGTLATTSYPGAFGTDVPQRDRRLGQIEFFTDVKRTNISCASCHIDDHQDGLFFEADVAGPRLRRVLSVRGTRDTAPLLQDQLLPDLVAFTDIVTHIERGGPICQPCVELNGTFFCFPGPEGTCTLTSNSENQQNTLYAKAITFFPNPNLEPDGSLSMAVPLPGGATGDARRGAQLFGQLGCASCHPAPLFTIDQFRLFNPVGFSVQPLRMRETQTPVLIPLREKCQDAARPTGVDGSNGFGVPGLRGIWDTFPLLVSGAAGLAVVGPEPVFTPGCSPGSSGCCTQLQSPLNPSGTPVPEQHLTISTKDALRAVLTPPLAVPGSGHGATLVLSSSDLDALIAYLRSL